MKEYRPYWVALLVMAALSPIGLYFRNCCAPAAPGANGAWMR